ncbi:MAG: roadblock/LC7 domain-containing protein [Anaerolineae bacterium]|nr:roadblock/LC7 domain-containing protein [Anaerolineae bacterium]
MTKTNFEQTLEQINKDGRFRASVLASSDGLPVAQAPSEYDSEIIAAMVALLRSVAQQTQDQVGIGRLDEVSVRADDRLRLVCRYFEIDGEDFILAVVVPNQQRYYRRETNRAIRELRLAWRDIVAA